MKKLKLLAITLALGGAVMTPAQLAPSNINYQGRLTQSSGVVVPDGLTGMRVRIFATASGGSALWDSGDLSVATKSGTFSILLGSGGMPAMSPAVFALGTVYVEVQPTGQAPLLPRQPIATVPWSFYAQTVSDGAITTGKLADLQVTLAKLALNSVSGAQIIDGSIDTAELVNLAVTGSKLASDSVSSAKLTSDPASLARVTGGAMQVSGGNIGLGTSGPLSRLHIRSNSDGADRLLFLIDDLNAAGSGGSTLGIRGHASSVISINNLWSDLQLGAGNTSGQLNRQVALTTSGNFGIGTLTPNSRLEVIGNVTSSGLVSGWAELYGATPFIDFHYANSSADYTARIISTPTGLSIEGDLDIGNKIAFAGASPTHRLTLPNIAGANGQGRANAWTTYSSRRWKENVRPIEDPLSLILQLNGVRFKWKPAQGGRKDIGLIAEDVAKVLPEIVSFDSSGRADGMSYDRLVALLLEGAKAQQGEIQALRESVARLNSENKRMQREISEIWSEMKKRR